MPTKVQFYSEVADYAAVQITSDIKNWAAFLRSSGRHYKYDFADQLMIHAQRPDATACADYDCWDKRLRRYVRRGSTGIALLRRMNNKPILTYVFDISDTGRKENAAPVYLWKYSDHYQQAVTARLEKIFDVPADKGISEQLIRISLQLAATCWDDHKHNIMCSLEDSLLEELDEQNVGIRFTQSVAVSTAYALLNRCGLSVKGCFDSEDFQYVYEFNSKPAAMVLGAAVHDCVELVLRQIEKAIKAYDRGERPSRPAKVTEFPDLSRPAQTTEQTTPGAEDTQVSSAPVFVQTAETQPPEKEQPTAPVEPAAAALPSAPAETVNAAPSASVEAAKTAPSAPAEMEQVSSQTPAEPVAEQVVVVLPQVLATASAHNPTVKSENFRILDNDLGTGGPKEKFWRNIKVIATLKQIERENR